MLGALGAATCRRRLPTLLPLLPPTGFGWQSWQGDRWWRTLRGQVADLAGLGVTHLWLPPPQASVSFEGYLPSQVGNVGMHVGMRWTIAGAAGAGLLGCAMNHRMRMWRGQGLLLVSWPCDWPDWFPTLPPPPTYAHPPTSSRQQLYSLDSRYGTEAELRALCADLLKAGIRWAGSWVLVVLPADCMASCTHPTCRQANAVSLAATHHSIQSPSGLPLAGCRPVADIVINHRCADEQDESGVWNIYKYESLGCCWRHNTADSATGFEPRPGASL